MSKTVILAIVGVVLGAAAAGGGFFFFFKPGGGGDALPTPEPTPVVVEGKLGPHITLESRVFNLRADAGRPPVYLKLEAIIEFETTDEEWAHVLHGCVASAEGPSVSPCLAKETELLHHFEEEIGTGRKLIEDAVTTIVTSKTLDEVSSPAGKEHLREEIKHAIEELIPHPHVTRVLFTDFVTQ